jgi:hypothetical protein
MYKLIFLIALSCVSTLSAAFPISEGGQKLGAFFDSLDVTEKWLGGQRIEWLSGKQNNAAHGVFKSHCSAFVASAADRLGIYILRPPAHKQLLLANAQYTWLKNQGSEFGWLAITNDIDAQRIANRGCLVVVVFQNPKQHKPGHIALIRPSDKSDALLQDEGPQLIQAGRENYNSIALIHGFRHHIHEANDQTLIYYGHNTTWCAEVK